VSLKIAFYADIPCILVQSHKNGRKIAVRSFRKWPSFYTGKISPRNCIKNRRRKHLSKLFVKQNKQTNKKKLVLS